MKLVTVSTFWNCEKYVKQCIESLKSQFYTDFIAYFIDDMSTDNSYEVAKNTINGDPRFILIKNNEKKYKTKNFIDVIGDNPIINWNDVIIEIDGDDKLSDNYVLGVINKTFTDDEVWICGTRWKDTQGRLGNYGKPNPEKARSTSWNFSHMRSYRAFLFRSIKVEHLKFEGNYFKAACDLGFGIPMLEMAGSEHFKYINEPLYTYHWHDNQTYSDNNSFGDKTLQGKIAKHIYGLPKYEKLVLVDASKDVVIIPEVTKSSKEVLLESLQNSKPFNPKIGEKTINYDIINLITNNPKIYHPSKNIKPNRENIPVNRNEIMELKKGTLAAQNKEFYPKKRTRDDSNNPFSKKNKY